VVVLNDVSNETEHSYRLLLTQYLPSVPAAVVYKRESTAATKDNMPIILKPATRTLSHCVSSVPG
jgi:hypothetical protein